jgi:CRP-like cAMP-binding protein
MLRSDASNSAPSTNVLLSALPSREYSRLLPHLDRVRLEFKAVLHEFGQPIRHLYFPTSGMLSLLLGRDGRRSGMEVGVVGREGMAGLSVFLGSASEPTRSMVQVPGEALRIQADKFCSLVDRDSKLHELLLRYVHVFLTQLTHGVSCNALHPVEKRLCRWLLTVHDRAASDRLPLTHEFLAAMLGVRRASVTEAARRLRQHGLIRYGGGQLTVLDRRGLERNVCGCYRLVKTELDRLLDTIP